MTRYMYVNSKRSSHAVERVIIGEKSRTVALCRYPLDFHPDWPMSFEPKKRVCKWCQETIDHREKVMQIKFRTLRRVEVKDAENPFRLPKGAVSVAVTYIDGCPYVHFIEVGKVVIKLSWLDHWAKNRPEYIECINDPTLPQPVVMPTLEENIQHLPLFEATA